MSATEVTGPRQAKRFGRTVSLVPPEERHPDQAWHLAELGSRCPHPEVTADRRADPYYDGQWDLGATASWSSFALARRQADGGVVRRTARNSADPVTALRRFFFGHDRDNRLRMLAAAGLWRTCTAEQAAAMTGVRSLLSQDMTPAVLAWQAGLLDIGQFRGSVGGGIGLRPRATLLRPSRSPAFDDDLTPWLTWPEWVAITGGVDWSAASQYDRHNVLATELALRLLEYADVGTVIGERLCSMNNLAGTGIGRPHLVNDNRAADLVVVREDGMRIAVEMTATIGTSFTHKVRRWAQLLAETPLAESGLVVLFLVAESLESRKTDGSYRRNAAAKTIAQAAREFPGRVGDRVAERMMVASWREWFPDRHLVHPMFLEMSALAPSGPPSALWQRVRLLGEQRVALQPWHPDRLTAILGNAERLAGIPDWFRDPSQGVPIWPLLLSNIGRNTIPVPPPRPGRTIKDHPLGAAQGNAGPIGIPRRLRGL